MKILVVDDDLTNRVILERLLSSYGDIHTVTDGIDAVDLFKLALEKKKPYDLICLDIIMPKMNGHEVLEKIRKIEGDEKVFGDKSVNIIMTTALSDGTNVFKAFKKQCEAYLVKPIDKKTLDKTLKKLSLI